MKYLKSVVLTMFFVVLSLSMLHAVESSKKILIIHSYHLGYEWSDGIQKGIMETLKDYNNLEISVEYMDLVRQQERDDYLNRLEELYLFKYGSKKTDVIIVVDDNAFDFILKRRQKLFKDVPIVFCGINSFKKDMIKGQKNITGVNEEKSVKETIEIALRLAGNPKKVAVIAGERLSEKKNLELFKANANIIPKDVDLQYLNGIEFDNIVEKVKGFSEKDIIFYLSYLNSPNGKVHTNADNLKLLAENSKAMVFTVSDHMVKNGVIGGKVTYAFSQGEEAAKMAISIVNGMPADRIPILTKSPNRFLFDGDALDKRNIPLAVLPKDAIIINKSIKAISSEYLEDAKKGFFSHELFENHGTVMLVVEPKTGTIIDANIRAELFYGYEKLVGKRISEINTLSEEELKEELRKAKELKRNYFNFKHRLSNGEVRDVEVYSYPIQFRDTTLLFSIVFDVTDKILAEKRAREDEKRILKILIFLLIISVAFVVMLLTFLWKKKRYEKELIEKNKILEEANKEIRTLKGIIPICMHCKKVRDDLGYWKQLEKYISEHTDALLSHGLCPDCADKYYKDFLNK